MKYLAHSENSADRAQPLSEHLQNVAKLASNFTDKWGCSEWGYTAGLLHDIGKFSDQFQDYVRSNANSGGDHSSAGAIYTLKSANVLAFPIRGHHGGLENKASLRTSLKSNSKKDTLQKVLERAQAELDELNQLQTPELPAFMEDGTDDEQRKKLEFFLRMVFSALVDADFLDTESHFQENRSSIRGDYPPLSKLWQAFTRDQEKLRERAPDTSLNRVRNKIYQQCLDASSHPQGLFSLTVPTGGGKTRSSMGFALKHALKHDLDRVIVVIPYTSIIEQTADTYRNIFSNERAVLEHHSGITPSDYSSQHALWWEVASENWEVPIVVTTTVQFFESLFANKPAKCRKLHNVSNSVVIIDEVQTLPESKLDPILGAISELAENYGTSVVLSTATQPAFSSGNEGINGNYKYHPLSTNEIIEGRQELFTKLKRVRYRTGNTDHEIQRLGWEDVANLMSDNRQAMTITNTKDDATSLYRKLKRLRSDEDVLHLSSNLCGAHRRDVLAEMKGRLDSDKRCLLVTTQVVEAGVDIDFPTVFRAVGPLDRIVQAAGRCNREGKLDKGQVLIFKPEDGGVPPGSYKTGTDTAEAMLADRDPSCLQSPETYYEYFSRLYQAVDMDAEGIQEMRKGLQFQDVAESFRLIDQDTQPVVVPWREDGEKLLSVIERLPEEQIGRSLTRKLQPYLVNLYQHEFDKAAREGLCREIAPDLWRWEGYYDDKLGLQLDPPDSNESLIF